MFETSIKHMLSGVDILVAGRYSRADEIRIKWVWETFYWAIRTFIKKINDLQFVKRKLYKLWPTFTSINVKILSRIQADHRSGSIPGFWCWRNRLKRLQPCRPLHEHVFPSFLEFCPLKGAGLRWRIDWKLVPQKYSLTRLIARLTARKWNWNYLWRKLWCQRRKQRPA